MSAAHSIYTYYPKILKWKKKMQFLEMGAEHFFISDQPFFTGRSFFLLALSLWQNRGFVVARIIEPKLITKNYLSQACRRGAYEQDILISTQQLMQDRTCRMPRGTAQVGLLELVLQCQRCIRECSSQQNL